MAIAKNAQSGLSLLLMLLVIVGIGGTLLVAGASPQRQKLAMEEKTQLALRQAKEALIAWSATHRTIPGYLPCPEDTSLIGSPNEGNAQSSCTNTGFHKGRLPWRTLGLDNPRDSFGEPLWYVLSPGFRQTPIIGSAGVATGQLQLDGVVSDTAALIIAPGPALTAQTRPPVNSASPPLPGNYLDLGNAGSAFISTGPAGTFNDRVIAVSTQELYRAMTFRVLAEIRGAYGVQNGLRRHYNDNGSFPPNGTALTALIFDNPTRSWLSPVSNPNLWFSQIAYTQLTPASARLTMGSTTLTVLPCLTTPCP
jgi:type II secretory pathway pseudopilin PulG